MWEWLLASVDTSRIHDISLAMSWHGRIMVLGWAILSPLAILVARYAKILPGQNWPEELDNQTWWHVHWITQMFVLILGVLAIALIKSEGGNSGQAAFHHMFGYVILFFGVMQGASGLLRGSKGGPEYQIKRGHRRGDHYDMTLWRRGFEHLHKSIGYVLMALIIYEVVSGMWIANAPNGMFVGIFLWWIGLIATFIILQKKGRAIDTYQAIWGPDPEHPGNQIPLRGWGTRRPSKDVTTKIGE